MWAPSFDIGLGARFGLLRVALLALFCAALVALGAWAGHSLGRAPLLVELAEVRQAHAETGKLQALASARGLSQAQQRGDALTTRLVTRQAQIDQLRKQQHDAIQALTTGRYCLSADAVRVLNSADAPTNGGPVDVPPPPGSAAAEDGTFATDTDVGQWSVHAKAQYDICRGRLDALIDFDAAPSTQPTTGHDH